MARSKKAASRGILLFSLPFGNIFRVRYTAALLGI